MILNRNRISDDSSDAHHRWPLMLAVSRDLRRRSRDCRPARQYTNCVTFLSILSRVTSRVTPARAQNTGWTWSYVTVRNTGSSMNTTTFFGRDGLLEKAWFIAGQKLVCKNFRTFVFELSISKSYIRTFAFKLSDSNFFFEFLDPENNFLRKLQFGSTEFSANFVQPKLFFDKIGKAFAAKVP